MGPVHRRPDVATRPLRPGHLRPGGPLVQDRVAVLSEVPGMVDFFFLAEPDIDEAAWRSKVADDPLAPAILAGAGESFSNCEWTTEALEAATRAVVEAAGTSLRKGQLPIRVAVMGRQVGPPLFESLALLGRDEVLAAAGSGAGAPRAGLTLLPRLPLIGRLHPILRVVILLLIAIVVYLVVSGVQVWLTSRESSPRPASAIIVMGAAQYDGVPSPDLQSRLNEALDLYREGLAPLIVVTGYKESGDRYTEAEAGGTYLEHHGVPSSGGRRSGGHGQLREPCRCRHGAEGSWRSDGVDHHRPVPRGPIDGHRERVRAHGVPDPDAHLADQRLVGGAVLLQGGDRGRGRAGDRVPRTEPPQARVRVTAHCRRLRRRQVASPSPNRGWCNRQHDRFWPCYWGFESSPPSPTREARAAAD